MVRRVPEGYRNVTPYLVNEGADKVIKFLRQAFGAAEKFPPMKRPDGAVMHAEMRIGDSVVMLGEASGQYRPMPACLYLYVEDVDATYRRALQAGGISVTEPKDQFYGDRSAGVRDPGGNFWWIATHKEDVSEAEIERRFKSTMSLPR
ncbi:MAG TPA: VOC family protein [Candidatus Eisenbacteria bacterium]|nr:VOC family protein [Candidatus Eisenbacteria bacterium]